MQLIVAILFVIIGGLNINKEKNHISATVLNDVILLFVFIISLVNIIISGFGIEYSNQPLRLLSDKNNPVDGAKKAQLLESGSYSHRLVIPQTIFFIQGMQLYFELAIFLHFILSVTYPLHCVYNIYIFLTLNVNFNCNIFLS